MAIMDLFTSLQTIVNERFAKDVRQAIHDGVYRANQVADENKDLVDRVAIRQDAVEQYNTQMITEMTDKDVISAPELIESRDGEVKLSARLDRDYGNLMEKYSYLTDISVSAREFGATTESGVDNAPFFQAVFDAAEVNGTIFIPAGRYRTTEPLPSGKNITWMGVPSRDLNHGTAITFVNCSGYAPTDSYNRLKHLHLFGAERGTDLENKVYGNIGIDLGVSDALNAGGFLAEDVKVSGFDVGLAIRQLPGSIWAGAYHDLYSLSLRSNAVNVLAINGATHTKFIGGTISWAKKHGIYAVNEIGHEDEYYSNLEFIGTTIESCGNPVGDGETRDLNSPNIGIYLKNAKINLIGSYLEALSVFADEESVLTLSETHVHRDVRMYSYGTGQINAGNSLAPHKHLIHYDNRDDAIARALLNNLESWERGMPYEQTIRLLAPSIRNDVAPALRWANPWRYTTLKAGEVERIKMSLNITITGGATGVNFAIDPRILMRASSAELNSLSYTNQWLPTSLYNENFENGKSYQLEFYWVPGLGGQASGGLNATDSVHSIQPILLFFKTGTRADYTADRLDVRIEEMYLEVYTKKFVTPVLPALSE